METYVTENFAGGSWLKIAEDEELWAAAEGLFTLAWFSKCSFSSGLLGLGIDPTLDRTSHIAHFMAEALTTSFENLPKIALTNLETIVFNEKYRILYKKV